MGFGYALDGDSVTLVGLRLLLRLESSIILKQGWQKFFEAELPLTLTGV
jgi:hypothetical protein